MRERTHEVKIRLNDKEFAHLNEMASKSIYNRETFLRLLFKFNSSLTPEEESRLMQIGDEVWALVKKLNVIYAPYYKEKKEKIDYE